MIGYHNALDSFFESERLIKQRLAETFVKISPNPDFKVASDFNAVYEIQFLLSPGQHTFDGQAEWVEDIKRKHKIAGSKLTHRDLYFAIYYHRQLKEKQQIVFAIFPDMKIIEFKSGESKKDN